jgi:hypothetical protein
MPAIPTSTRFFQPGIIAILFAPTIADATGYVPTTTELTNATDLTKEVDDIAGWSYSTTFIETRDAASRIRPKLAGAVSLDDSSITFNGSQTGTDARTVFTLNQSGFIIMADAGLGTGKKAEVFPVQVGSIVRVRSLDNTNFKIRVDFGVTNVPKDVTLP